MKPIYITARQIAREINMNPNNMPRIITKWKNRTDNPPPTPDAYCDFERGTIPLWLKTRLPEWREWKARREAIVEELQAQEQANAAQDW